MEEKLVGYMLHHTPLSQSRVIVDVFTAGLGRRQGVLRLGKKDSRAQLTPMTLLSFHLVGKEHQQLKNMREVVVEDHCFDLAADYLRLALLSHWGWLILKTQPEGQQDPGVFRLLSHLLSALKAGHETEYLPIFNLYFEIWLLHFCGVFGRQLPPIDQPLDGLSEEERLFRRINRQLLTQVFQKKIEECVPLALKLGSLSRTTATVGTLWERLLDRELKTRQVFYKQLMARGRFQ